MRLFTFKPSGARPGLAGTLGAVAAFRRVVLLGFFTSTERSM